MHADPFLIRTGPVAWPPAPRADGLCPVCAGLTAAAPRWEYCLWCNSASPGLARMAHARAAGRVDGGDAYAQVVANAKRKLKRAHSVILSERERRQIWMGSRRMFDGCEGLDNLSAVGRAWLREIAQEPDWSLTIDKHCNVVGGAWEGAA